MKKVMFISGCGGDTQRYRVFNQMEQLKVNGIEVVEYSFTDYRIYAEIDTCDCIIMHRTPYIQYIDFIIKKIHQKNKKVYFDIDDIVFDEKYAKESDGIKYLSEDEKKLYYEGVKRYKKVVQKCDGAIVSTEFLYETIRKYNNNVCVNRNALSNELIKISEEVNQKVISRINSKIRIGYFSGTKTHNKDFEEVSEALYDLMKKREDIILVIGGLLDLPEKFLVFNDRVERKPLVKWTDLPNIIKTVDINLAPLELNNPFCKAKSELKYIEAAILKVPTVASKIDAFEVAIKHNENGLLASNKSEWIDALEKLIDDRLFYKHIQQKGYDHVIRYYNAEGRGKQLIESIKKLQKGNNTHQVDCKGLVVNFLIPQPFKGSGGHTTIFRMIKGLADNGHEVNVYVQDGKNFEIKKDNDLKEIVDTYFFKTNANFYTDKGKFKESDAFIATSWPTAYVVNGCENTSKKMYFVQDFEPYFYPMSSEYKMAENSYKIGLSGITIGSWLTKLLSKEYKMDCDYIDFAVDKKVYKYEDMRSQNNRTKIIFYARATTPRRGFELAIGALKRVYDLYGEKVEIILFGGENLKSYNVDFKYTDKGILSQQELNRLYNEADIALVCSLTNCSLLPLELMATKCAVVDIDSPTVYGIMENEVDSLLAHPDSFNISESIIRLIEDRALRQKLTNVAFNKVQKLDWSQSTNQFENIIVSKLIGFTSGCIIRSEREELYNQVGVPITNIVPSYTIKFKIHSSKNQLHRIDLFVGNYGRTCVGNIIVNVKRTWSSEVPITSCRYSLRGLKDNNWLQIEIEPIINSADRDYIIEIYTDKEDLALYGEEAQEETIYVAGTAQNYSPTCAIYYKTKEYSEKDGIIDQLSEQDNKSTISIFKDIDIEDTELISNINAVISNNSNRHILVNNRIIRLENEINKLNTEVMLFKDSIIFKIYIKMKSMSILKPLKKILGR